MKGGKFKIYNYWYNDSKKGTAFKQRLTEKFNGKFTELAPADPSNNSFRHAITYNQLNQANKNMSGKFLINDMGVQIADNFPNFKKVQADIIKAFSDLKIVYNHNPEENIDEINE